MPKKAQLGAAEHPTPQSDQVAHREARERILEAAMAEFSLGGFAGARVGNIAHRANVSQQLLFHYFGSKRGLQEAAIEHFLDHAEAKVRGDFSSLAQRMQISYEQILKDRDATRLLIWESLELEEFDTTEDHRRAAIFRVLVASFAKKQSEGILPAAIEPELLAMTVLGLSMLPQVLPMYIRSIFGLNPNDPEFIAKWKQHLGHLGELLAPSKDRQARTPNAAQTDTHSV